jgi:thiol-disulfide isomerase/thioredoxin
MGKLSETSRALLFFLTLLALLAPLPSKALDEGQRAPCVGVVKLGSPERDEQCILERSSDRAFLLLEFFSVRCPHCRASVPEVTRFARAHASRLEVRAVMVDSDEAAVRSYVAATPALSALSLVWDPERDGRTAFGVIAFPTYFLLDSANDVVVKHVGALTSAKWDQIRSRLGP